MATCGKRINELLIEKNMTKKQLAQELDISYPLVIQYTSDVRHPSVRILKKMSQILDCDVDYIEGVSNVKKRVNIEYIVEKYGDYDPSDLEMISIFKQSEPHIQKAIKTLLKIK